MNSEDLVEAHVAPDIKEKAARVLDRTGLTISDVLRIVLVRMAEEDDLPPYVRSEDPEYDAWFREKVQDALDDPRPSISNTEAKRRMGKHHAALRAKFG